MAPDSPVWVPIFLDSLRKSPNVSRAARDAGIHRSTAYELKESDPAFAAAWQDALDESTDNLVGRAYERANIDSDTLMIFLLKCHRREVYGDVSKQQVEHSGPGGAPLLDFSKMTDEQLRAIVAGQGGGRAGA